MLLKGDEMTSLIKKWDPFREFNTLPAWRFFGRDWEAPWSTTAAWNPSVDIFENDNEVVVN